MLKIPPTWDGPELSELLKKPLDFIKLDSLAGHTIYPAQDELLNALHLTPLNKVRVVILGQDPYHGEGEAMGLAFSVKRGIKIPPSLVNIYKELHSDLSLPIPSHGDLTNWAKQGVLLLNTVLSVRKDEAASHQKKGWEEFTDCLISKVSSERNHVVFILWGLPAQKKIKLIDTSKHLVITSPHPSPLSSYRGFFGSSPFSKANQYLLKHHENSIDWRLD